MGALEEGMLVTPHFDFSADDVEDETWQKSCLAIQEGEVVEVMAAGGGWLYGRITGVETERVGYFPENRITWLCSPVHAGDEQLPGKVTDDGGELSGSAPGWLVRVGSSFSPGSPGDAEEELADQTPDFSECCLALALGD